MSCCFAFLDYSVLEITIGVAVGVLALGAGAIVFFYQKVKKIASFTSMDWLAHWSEVSYSGSNDQSNDQGRTLTRTKSNETSGTLPVDNTVPAKISTIRVSDNPQIFFRGNMVMLRFCDKPKIDLNNELQQEVRDVHGVNQENLVRFVGAVLGPERTAVLYEYCFKGNLQVICQRFGLSHNGTLSQ